MPVDLFRALMKCDHTKFEKKVIRDIVEALLNTPGIRVEMEDVFRKALVTYEEKNIAEAVMGYWDWRGIILLSIHTMKRILRE